MAGRQIDSRIAQSPTFSSHLLWENERFLVIDKAAGVSLATPKSSAIDAVLRLLVSLVPEDRSCVYDPVENLQLVHRLDVGTSGLVLLARDPEAHAALSRALSERRAEKTYLALVWGRPSPRKGRWDWPLGPDTADRRRMKVDPHGKPSASGYEVVATSRHASLLQLQLETGRTHQLRVHCAHSGHLIVGDDLYGGPRHKGIRDQKVRDHLSPTHPLLHAWRLHLPQTAAGPEIILQAPLPPDFQGTLDFLKIRLEDQGSSTAATGPSRAPPYSGAGRR